MTTKIILFLKYTIKYYTQLKDEERDSNSVDTVNIEFSRLPELDSEWMGTQPWICWTTWYYDAEELE